MTEGLHFEIIARDRESGARVGRLQLPHGVVQTPVFMPVGTQGMVKTLTPFELAETGTEMMVCNAYHLYLRPGHERVRSLGGIHSFSGWHKPVLADSGGYQVYSLAALNRVSDDGVEFQSHIDGSRHMFTPERVLEIERALGTDVAMCLDECPPFPSSRPIAEQSVVRTTRWAERSRQAMVDGQVVFAIVQGATYPDLRARSAAELVSLDFPGYAIGGLYLGEPADTAIEMARVVTAALPDGRPRYLMGAGYAPDIVRAVALGVDMFDCVLPSRNGRTGTAFTSTGRVVIRNAQYADDTGPLDGQCDCLTCRSFSRAWLRHLFLAEEALGPRLLTLHNVRFYQRLMAEIRAAIVAGSFGEMRHRFAQAGATADEEY